MLDDKALSPASHPELFDHRAWLAAPDSRRRAIATAVVEALGEGYALSDDAPPAPPVREAPSEWKAVDLEAHYAALARPTRDAAWRIVHVPTGTPLQIIAGGRFRMGLSNEEEAYLTSGDRRASEHDAALLASEAGFSSVSQQATTMRPAREVLVAPFLLAEAPLTGDMLARLGLKLASAEGDDEGEDEDEGEEEEEPVDRLYEGPDMVTYVAPRELGHLLAAGDLRLPSEAEWEHACRAGTTTLYFWGNELPDAPNARVNTFGLAELGNHPELCADLWHPTYEGAPSDGRAWLEGGEPRIWAVRGGAAPIYPWQGPGWQILMSAMRFAFDADGEDEIDTQFALRLARSIPTGVGG